MLRQAMVDTGWTVDALAAWWDVDRGYVWKLVNGEKPWSIERVLALPDDLEARLEHLRAESFGRIVVEPLSGLAAQRAFVAGFVGILAESKLPARADRMARMEPSTTNVRKAGVA